MTETITIYEAETGRILRDVTCSVEFHSIQVRDGEAFINGKFPAKSYKVQDGVAVSRDPDPLTPEQINSLLFVKLHEIDVRSIRALREGHAELLAGFEAQAVELRSQLIK